MTVDVESRPRALPVNGTAYGSNAYKLYVLVVLTLIYSVHALDRNVATIVMEPVKAEFQLNDSQLGLLSGLAWSVAFTLMGIPMGLMADRMNRRNLLAAVLAIWSGLTALCAGAFNFVSLVIARMGVGAAESGGAPTAIPMLTDIFPRGKRATALGFFYLSTGIGGIASAYFGSIIATDYGWRAVFLAAGIPGLILALLLVFTVREPRRGQSDEEEGTEPIAEKSERAPSFGETLAYLYERPALIALMAACVLTALVIVTVSVWMVSFFMRIHGLTLKEAGAVLAFAGGIFGAASTVLAGLISDKLLKYDRRWPLRVVWLAIFLSTVAGYGMVFAPSVVAAIVFCAVFNLTNHGYPVITYTVLMERVALRMRGTVMSLMQLLSNLFAVGLGPVLAGFLSDLYGGPESLRYSLASALLFNIIAVGLYLVAQRGLYGPGERAAGSDAPA